MQSIEIHFCSISSAPGPKNSNSTGEFNAEGLIVMVSNQFGCLGSRGGQINRKKTTDRNKNKKVLKR